MSALLSPTPVMRFYDNNNNPLAGGQLWTYQAGTTIPVTTYTDSTAGTPNTNPIILNARGEAPVWLSPVQAYKFVLEDANGNTIWTTDQITSPAPVAVGNMTDEKGSGGQVGFVAGVDFTAGTSTTLTLSQNYGSSSNLWVAFDAGEQGGDTFSLSGTNNETLTFNAPIPVGTNKVYVKGGTSLTVGTPGIGTITDVNVASNAAINSSKLSYLAPYGGSASRSVLSKLSDVVSILDFPGADPTGVKDSTSAMTLAHATGRLVYYPAGTYKFTTISFAQGGIIGDGLGQTILQTSDLTGSDVITYTGAGTILVPNSEVPIFRDFQLTGSASKTAGYGIRFAPSSGELDFIFIENVTIEELPSGIAFNANAHFKVIGCNFLNYIGNGMLINNTNNADSGDSCISGCLFNTNRVNGSTNGIFYTASGGLKFVNSKILGSDFGFTVSWSGTTAADLLISNVSIENQTAYGIFMGQQAGAGSLGSVVIVGNEIAAPKCIGVETANFVTLMDVSGNILNITTTSGVGIEFGGVPNFMIGPNIIVGQVGGSPIGISTTSSCTNGKILPQTFTGIPGANCISNGSSSTYIVKTPQSGTGTTNASTGYGSLNISTLAVTFPVPFLVAPNASDIQCIPTNTGSGGVAAFANAISTTGFTLNCFAVSAGTQAVAWTANGII